MPICVETDENGSPFVTLGPYQLRLDLEEISGEFEERAKTELLESPERVQEGLAKFRELIKGNKSQINSKHVKIDEISATLIKH